jgi:trans-aconitate 2-methyltransferase
MVAMWNAPQYLKFEDERTQPCRDLVSRIQLEAVHRVVDLGCGPGNSTRILRRRWPDAEVTGLDSSPEMIASARQAESQQDWVVADVREWARISGQPFDVVFANATLQWVPDHDELLPNLMNRTRGALAFQIPDQSRAPAHCLMRELAMSERWRPARIELPRWHGRESTFYYDLLQPMAQRLDLWETEYIHILDGAPAVVEWYKGTALRPYLEALGSTEQRAEFTDELISGLQELYKPQADGRILFRFRRLFVVAHK